MDNGEPLTTGDIAAVCHVSQVTVFRWIKRGFLQAYSTPGGHYRIRNDDLVAFLKKQGMPVPEDLTQRNGLRSVLLVDDDLQVLETLSLLLSRESGLTVEVARSGYEACIKAGAIRPDLIILDLFMPRFDGFAVMREIRANPETRSCKILVLSGYGTEENVGKAKAHGANDFLEKPVEGSVLVRCVKSLLTG
ncbi:MAG: response regulator [Planctomycetes bacterium]|nr:response regulator [Planctomycetota bacterium]